jgi:glycosyltransferase involved in cell wall biosynthesis
LKPLRVGYVPISATLDSPGDRRRFVYYAQKRGIPFEIADPEREYDLVILSQQADISVWCRYPKAKLVYDLIDSYLVIPRSDLKGLMRGFFKFLSRQSRYLQLDHWKAIGGMCVRADAVVCSTEEQRNDILKFCPNVHLILDAHMGVTRRIKTEYRASQPFRLVWEGLPHTLGSLKMIRQVLQRLRACYPIEVHVVTDPVYFRFLGKYGKTSTIDMVRRMMPDVYFHEWKQSNFADIVCSCDLAVIPLSLDDPFAAGKPENKLLLFWRMGMPVVTSASPAYVRAMRAASLDLASKNESDWFENLERLLNDEDARRQAGNMGRSYTESEFSENVLLARWDKLFETLGFTFGVQDSTSNQS